MLAAGILAVTVSGCSTPTPSGEPPRTEYDRGRLSRVVFDANHNGKNDAVGLMDGTRIRRIELDLDENGKIDRWDIYDASRRLEKVGLSQRNDGVMDAQAYYRPNGDIARLELSTARDGRFNRTEFYEAGRLVRSEEDTDGDGRPDKWDSYRPNPKALAGEPAYAITSVAFDSSHRGIPDHRFVFSPNGSIALVESDPDGDGQFTPAPPPAAQK
jgi:hypothetical protein